MITVIATLKVQLGKEKEFEEAARPLLEHVRQHEPGTREYVFMRATGDPTSFAFYEVYDDEAAFAAHGSSEPMKRFFGAVRELLAGRPEIVMYEELGGKH
jgi:quinol monooxygenase YgiN